MAISVTLDWTFSGLCTSFHIYKKDTGQINYSSTPYASVAGNVFTYTDAPLSPGLIYGQSYTYKVAAVNAAGEGLGKEVVVPIVVPLPAALDTLVAVVSV
jgi:hypothetical protein